MYFYKTIGEVLENERQKKDITRQELCDGLCDESTYSRYENDIYIPKKMLLDRFMERLGLNPNKITYIASTKEVQYQKTQVVIRDALRNGNYLEARKQLDVFKKKYSIKNKFTEQFILFAEGYLSEIARNLDSATELYNKAWKITEGNLPKNLYSLMEYDIKLKIISLKDDGVFDQLQFEEKFLREKNDDHILKIAYYGKVIYLLCLYSIDKITTDTLIEILDRGLRYQYKMCQLNGIKELLELKLKVLGNLTENEKSLLDAEKIVLLECEKVDIYNYDSIC